MVPRLRAPAVVDGVVHRLRRARGAGGAWGVVVGAVLSLATLALAVAPRAARAQPGDRTPPPITVVAPPGDSLALLARWSVRTGLPQQSVTELAFDRDGFLWGATFGGLIRFDGDRIEVFGLDRLAELGSNRVSAVATARAGGVWAGAAEGAVVRVDAGGAVHRLPPIPSLRAPVERLVEAADGTIWAWAGAQLHRWRDGRWTLVVPRLGRGVLHVLAIVPSARGDTVLVSDWLGVRRIVGDAVEPLRDDDALRRPWHLRIDRHGRLWVGGPDGLRVVEPPYERGAVTRVLPGVVRALAADAAGDLWVAATDTIWRVRAPRGAAPTVARMVVEPGRYLSLATTPDGVVVAGTLGDGLLTFVPRILQAWRFRQGSAVAEATNLVGVGDGGLVASSVCGAALVLDTALAVRRAVRFAPGRAPCIVALAHDAAGRTWLSTDQGLHRLDADGTARPVGTRASTASLRPLVPLGRDTLVAGTPAGDLVHVAADGTISPVPGWRRTAAPVTTLVRDADGTLWIGGTGTVTRQRRGALVTWDTTHGVPRGVVRAIHVTRDGRTWVGSYGGGLAVLAPGGRTWRRLALADPTVIAIAESRDGTLWLAQNRGTTVLRAASLARWLAGTTAESPAEALATHPDATEGNNGTPAVAALPGGRFAFVTVEGLLVADPARLPPPPPPPRLVVLELHTAHDTLAVADTVRLPIGDRTLDVRVAAPAFRNATELRFRYRLERRDARWLELGARRQFLLTDLEAGRHVLRVQLAGPDGVTTESAPLVLVVPPRWWETPWAALAVLGLLAALGALYLRQRTGVLAARNAALQAQLDARRMAAETTERHRRELAQVGRVAVAGEMTAALMHELGQPLTAIVNNAEVARRLVRGGREPRAIEEALDDIAAQGARAAQVVTSLRRFLRRGVGATERLAVAELVAEVSALVRQEYADARVALEARVEPGTPPVRGERVLLQQALVNLLTNACDALRGRDDARVLLRARGAGDGGVRISVVDNGPGVAPPLRETVFDAFVSGKESGMGMGLAIARRIVEGHGGTLALGAARGGGAVFSMRLPGPEEGLHD